MLKYIIQFGCILYTLLLTAQVTDATQVISTITITNIGGPTQYNDVLKYSCSQSNQLVCSKGVRTLPSSCVGQFQDDFAYIFRGPMQFKFIGVFYPKSDSWQAQGHWQVGSQAKVWGQSSLGNSKATQNGVAFTGNMGPFSMCNGYSQSYITSDAKSGCDKSEIFSGSLPKGTNMQMMSSEKCEESCGYYEGVGLKGWQGQAPGFSRMFVHVATMPDPQASPAAWLLNGRLVRTRQYGADTCYSRQAGQPTCGELDMFEVVEELSDKSQVSSTLYMSKGRKGNRDAYSFKRNYDKFNVFITIIHEDGYIQIIRLDDEDWQYGLSVSTQQVDQWLSRRELVMSQPGPPSPPNCKAPRYQNAPGFSNDIGFSLYKDPKSGILRNTY